MTPPIVKRYLIAFDKYKWIGLTSFALVVAGSTVVAMQPEPPANYVAEGALTYVSPPVFFLRLVARFCNKVRSFPKKCCYLTRSLKL